MRQRSELAAKPTRAAAVAAAVRVEGEDALTRREDSEPLRGTNRV
jgi:hypothetical protein